MSHLEAHLKPYFIPRIGYEEDISDIISNDKRIVGGEEEQGLEATINDIDEDSY